MTSQAVSVRTDKQPTGLYVLFLTEMWERFSYYAMRGILVLYLIKVMQFSESHASKLYGTVTSLIYLSPLIGGYIADRFWGQRRAIIVGGILIAIGQFSLASNPTLSFL
jgi:POT family proton-dependent oligopeptide transporter